MTDAAATTTTPPPAATGIAEGQWWTGLDDETKGYIQNKGLSTKTPTEAFSSVAKFHREAERMIGAPASELLRLPKEANSPDWSNVWKRLGALNAPEDYKFEGVKHAGDKPLSDALADTLRKVAHTAHLSNDTASQVAREVVKHLDGIETAKLADDTVKQEAEKKALKDNWGANGVTNMVIAKNAAAALGIPPEAVTALEKVIGYSKVMDMFRVIGTKIGEDRYVSSGGQSSGTAMTKEAAIAEKKEIMRDEAWVKRYTNGGVEEARKMSALNKIITGYTG